MTRINRGLTGLMACAVFLAAGSAFAADPIKVGPNVYKLKFENVKVRVSEIRFKPGDTIPMHEHSDHFVYVLTAGTLQLTHPDGKSAEFSGTPGQVVWIPAESHSAVNTGTTEFSALVVELKPLPAYTENQ